ncbi:hypothetical protein D9601_02470 [Sphingomonas sp. MA1305]|uniref:hypothetical protein n=1 Tax=Sphingomonas sp. MA1305 TaxID=2479204 RepID=UPI0018E01860|nr:hypothetical protein [Sphingomonas sp. MA1305]MBI0474230.1 hypothetical protein [Sphingomonas sp. MA1305]
MASAAPIEMEDVADEAAGGAEPLATLVQLAQSRGDLSALLDDQTLSTIGHDVVQDYERDLGDRQEWEETVRKALKRAAQEKVVLANAPAYRNAHVDFPILTVAAQQFNARAYPAICKPGDMVRIKVIGSDRGRPAQDEQGNVLVQLNGKTMTQQQAAQALQGLQAQMPPAQEGQPAPDMPQPEPMWAIPPGAKQARADRVADYLNVYIEFRMDDWEEDTDALLTQLPIVGCGFRKCWWEEGKECHAYVPALDLIVPQSAKSLKTTPRITERMPEVYPYQIKRRIAAGDYRAVDLTPEGDDAEAPRLLLEQHRFLDLDGDGADEPYIVTIDKTTSQVLRIEANFGPDDIVLADDDTTVLRIERQRFYVKYGFLPDPKGGFYDIGFGHLVEQLGDVINASINQMLDAGHAQIAGGGFIASGLRLQSNSRNEAIRWMPGEYKTVSVAAGDLRAGIVERTFPNPSPILFQLLELMLGAAKDITSVKDIVTGNAPNTAPVGTTLALIEQGLQVFTAIYKRVYRSLGDEFSILFANLAKFGGEEAAADYLAVLDDPAANFEGDFGDSDMDIKPVADPTAVTSAQRIAKAQVLAGMKGQGLDDMEINRRILEAASIENIDALMPKQSAPDPLAIAELRVKTSQANLNDAKAAQAGAAATKTGVEVGHSLGESDGYAGRVPGVDAGPADPMGAGGAGNAGEGAGGGMGGSPVGAF